MKKILFLLAFLINALLVFSQAPIPLNRLSRSSDRFMMMMSDTNRYASYQHFNYWLSKFADSLNLQNPYWLGSILPQQSVSIGAERHNFIISNGIIGSFATDTTANGWILQSYVSGLNADGVGKIGGRNYLTGKRYGIDFDGATPTILSGNVGLSLANEQVQDSTLDNAYRYIWTVPAGNALTGVGEYVREDSIEGVWLKTELEGGNDVNIETINYLDFSSSGESIYIDPSVSVFDYSFGVLSTLNEIGLSPFGIDIISKTNSDFSSYRDNSVSIGGENPEIRITKFNGVNSESRFISDGFDTYMYNAGSGQNSFGFFAATGGNLNTPAAIGNGKNLGEFLFNGYSNGAYRLAGGIRGNSKNVSGSTVQQDLIFFDNGGTARFTMDLTSQGNFTMTGYPNTRDDAGNPVNILATSAAGVEESHALAGVFETISAQSNSDQILASDVAATVLFQYVNQNTAEGMSIQGDTVVLIPNTGTYSANVQCSAEASLSNESTTIQFVGTNITDLGFNQPITIAAGGNGSSFGLNRVFTTSAANATLRFRVGASTWTSGSVFINAGCSLTVERKY